uniref:Ribosomal protein L15 n=1 Tax=Sus scrofa TaxID=9823 RepID=A0A8D1UJ17_PIG
MGASKYIQQLWGKKPPDVICFLPWVRRWQYRQLSELQKAPCSTLPDNAWRLGYKAKPGYVIYRRRVRCSGHKGPVPRGAPTASLSTVVKILRTSSLTLPSLIHSIKLSEEILACSGIAKPVHKHREMRGRCNTLQLHRYR